LEPLPELDKLENSISQAFDDQQARRMGVLRVNVVHPMDE
jgi:hypothetical protein